MSLATKRAALKTGLETINDDKLKVLAYEPEQVTPTVLIVGFPTGTYDDDFEHDVTPTFPVVLLVSRSLNSTQAAEYIDPFIDPSGTKSVPAAVDAVAGARCVGWSNYGGGYTVGELEYVGVTFEVQML